VSCPDETALVGFLEGRLDRAAVAEVDAHLASCAACREVLAAVAPAVLAQGSQLDEMGATRAPVAPAAPPTGVLPRGAAVGRYVILGLVGRGGMGDVYAAYDPELDRKIALKLLNDGHSGSGSPSPSRGRLLKEAKSIARLTHPNVVVVHDAGTIDHRVFIAMEFVEGQTLGAWLGGRPRTWSEVREIFLSAGRGLAAAHAARIVHRDFKPQNVMVANDGAVRVMDFGLASDSDDTEDHGPVKLDHHQVVDFASTTALALTRTGSLVGTPAYMAPEQFRGEAADARTDQFSFCVSLYEALCGERPFATDSLAVLMEAVVAGRLRDSSQRARLPAWLRKVLLRGLANKRDHRFPAMEDLLAALARDPARQRRRVMVGVGLAGLLLAGGALSQRALQRSDATACRNPGARLAEVWETPESSAGASRPRRDAGRAAFLATGAPHAAALWDRTAAILDGYSKRWTAMYSEACEATHVRGDQSAEVLDLRMDCLNHNRESLRALTDLLATADTSLVGDAIDAANALPDVGRCADVAVLRAVVPPPRDPAVREQVESVRKRAAEARALADARRWKEGRAKALSLSAEAERLGYEPLVAEVSALLGYCIGMTGDAKLGAEHYERALWAAEATRHDEVAAEASVMLVGFVGYNLERLEEGERWARLAEAILERMGPGHERLQGWLAQNRGLTRMVAGQLTAAERDLRTAVTLKRKADGGDSPDVARSLDGLANVNARRGDFAAAVDLTDQARVIFEQSYGPEHILVGLGYSNRCEYLNGLGRYQEALDSCQRAMAILGPALGRDHLWLGYALTATGNALIGLRRASEALAPLRRAVEIRKRVEFSSAERGETWFALARAQWDAGTDRAAARAAAETARSEYAKAPAAEAKQREVEAWLAARGGRQAAGAGPALLTRHLVPATLGGSHGRTFHRRSHRRSDR
jgi:tetratricopeptide (TPR) repeat protein